jgi:hypothetical protein
VIDTHGRWPLVAAASVAPAWALVIARRDALARDDAWVAGLAFPLLVAHQTEEWVRPGGFLEFCNERFLQSGRPTWPLTERLGFHINVTLGWATALGGLALWPRTPTLAALVLGIEAGNVALHAGMAAGERTYNPGVATAALGFLPHVVLGARALRRSGRMTKRSTALAAAGSLAISAGLPALMHRRMSRAGDQLSSGRSSSASDSTSRVSVPSSPTA